MKEITQEMIEALRKPLPEKAITQHPTKTYLSSIKPPYVIERLNEVFGLNGWRDSYEVVSTEKFHKASAKKGEYDILNVVVKGTLEMPEYGIIRNAFGGNDQEDFGDAYKGACTDALTKMAMMVYIGMDVYKGLGSKSDYKPEPAGKSDYHTIEGLLENKTTDEHGYWFKIGERIVFKDESSPVDASPLWEAAVGCKFRLRVIERKTGSKTLYELVEVLGEPTPPSTPTDAPKAKSEPTVATVVHGPTISEKQRVRMMAIAGKSGYNYDQIKAILAGFGFEHSHEVTRAKYEAVCKQFESSSQMGQE